MKILLYDWEALSQKGLVKGLKSLGHEVVIYSKEVTNHLMDEEFLTDLALKLVKENIDFAISFDFIPMVSLACKAAKRVYISWIYSCPHYPLQTDAAYYEGNFFFVFDRAFSKRLKQEGLSNVFHLPLAVDTEVFQIPQREDVFPMDVSFVGSLYTDERNYFDQIKGLPDYLKGYIDGICEAQKKLYGMDMIRSASSEQFIKVMKEYIPYEMSLGMHLDFEEFLISIIQKKTTIEERKAFLELLSEKHNVTIYTGSDTTSVPKLVNKGRIDYYLGMPDVFRKSKINLNITLRSIDSGIPLRALDILGCGGVLLSNYQEELAEYFVNGKEVLLWGSKEEMLELVQFYLKEDSLRENIRRKGYEKASSEFNYKKILTKMFRLMTGEM